MKTEIECTTTTGGVHVYESNISLRPHDDQTVLFVDKIHDIKHISSYGPLEEINHYSNEKTMNNTWLKDIINTMVFVKNIDGRNVLMNATIPCNLSSLELKS